jgi:hypothetical protein
MYRNATEAEPSRKRAASASQVPVRQPHPAAPGTGTAQQAEGRLAPQQVLGLQRAVGNAAVSHMLALDGINSTARPDRASGIQRAGNEKSHNAPSYDAGYRAGRAGNDSNPGPMDPNDLLAYRQGYADGVKEAEKTKTSAGPKEPNEDQATEKAPQGPMDMGGGFMEWGPGQESKAQKEAAEAAAARKRGKVDGYLGHKDDPIDAVGFKYAVPYEAGYKAGQEARKRGVKPKDIDLPKPALGEDEARHLYETTETLGPGQEEPEEEPEPFEFEPPDEEAPYRGHEALEDMEKERERREDLKTPYEKMYEHLFKLPPVVESEAPE